VVAFNVGSVPVTDIEVYSWANLYTPSLSSGVGHICIPSAFLGGGFFFEWLLSTRLVLFGMGFHGVAFFC
jgi:hypothetical protein